MGNSIKNPFKVALCIIGTVVGAGFASGQEIMSFFIIYGKKSIFGLIIFALLLLVYLFCLLDTMRRKNISTYKGYLNEILPQKLSPFVELAVALFSLSTFVIMLSGFGEVVHQTHSVPNIVGAVLMSAVCFFVFSKKATGIVNAGAILTPVIIVFVVIIGILSAYTTLPTGSFNMLKKITDNFFFSSLIYISYNTLSLTPVLVGLKDFIKSKKDIFLISLFSAAILGIMAFFIWYSLVKFEKNIVYNEIPMLDVATYIGNGLSHTYPVVLFAAMLTTAISSGFAFLESANKIFKISYRKLSAFLCVMSALASQIGFSALISSLYSFFGYIGIAVFIAAIFKYFLKK